MLKLAPYCIGLMLVTLLGCDEVQKVPKKVKPYTGPVEEINNVRMLYSEAAILKVKMTTTRQLRYANDNKVFPEPVNIVFYGPAGEEVTTLRSDSGRYNRVKDLYTVLGHVVVLKKLTKEKLLSNELNWNPNTKKVYTEQRVQVISQLTGERIYGLGMDAEQDFSRYSFRRVTGQFNMQ